MICLSPAKTTRKGSIYRAPGLYGRPLFCYNLAMPQTPSSIILLTGSPGAGKTTIAEALSQTFARSAHVPVDFFRKMIKAGYASPQQWNQEVERQYRLARKNAALTAKNLAREGFTVIVDDIVRQKWVEEWKDDLQGCSLHFVLLLPSPEVAKQRNRTREVWTVDEAVITSLHELLAAENTKDHGWFVIDTSHLTVQQTVEAIRKQMS
jgi:chloramphenicol 3-O-phosphotransferase